MGNNTVSNSQAGSLCHPNDRHSSATMHFFFCRYAYPFNFKENKLSSVICGLVVRQTQVMIPCRRLYQPSYLFFDMTENYIPKKNHSLFCNRLEHEKREKEFLAPFASLSSASKGRQYPEEEHEFRTCFQRDRDRIIHSTAFRRLESKTQVFVTNISDHYRTRLTHTLEVAQIARTIARMLSLNEDLCEAEALVHDIGHPPFGHAGERVLQGIMENHGGFEHNLQALRIVDLLERRYPGFPGLNLTIETRRGILKKKPHDPKLFPGLAERLSLEAQVMDIADEISYTTHDLDDGIESGLLLLQDVDRVSLWRKAREFVRSLHPELDEKRERYQIIIRLINNQVEDVVKETMKSIEASGGETNDNSVSYSPEMQEDIWGVRSFLMEHLYRNPRVMQANSHCSVIIKKLYEYYYNNPKQMPPAFKQRIETEGLERSIVDYIAGMTDRFAEENCRETCGE